MAQAEATPNSYRDPFWTQLAETTAQKVGLPAGLLSAVVLHGEKSNADQVSEAGAKTPFQITPTTRDAILKRDGIDAYLSPENAAEAAALVLKDGLQWAKGRASDPATQERLAAGFYHGGGDTANWGPRTNAYIARVSAGSQQAKGDALANDFAAFMKENPAVPAAAAPTAAAGADPLAADFGARKQQQDATAAHPDRDYSPQIPDTPTQLDEQGRPYVSNARAPQPGLGDKALGAGEAGLATATGIPAYIAGAGSYLDQFNRAIANKLGDSLGVGGPSWPVQDPDQAATQTAQQLTYQPRTSTGQDYAQSLSEAMQPLAGLNPVEGALIASGARPAVQATAGAARAAPEAITDGAAAAGAAIRDRYAALTGGASVKATPGSMGSAGAAGTDIALQRAATAADLPVPIKLTRGQATRDFAQQQFEGETAKNPDVGEPLRENAAKQNQQLAQNFDALIDRTGAEKASDIEAGRFIVDDTLKKAAARSKAEYDAKYAAADKAGETLAPVDVQPVLDYLNTQPEGLPSNRVPDAARKYAETLGIATRDADGNLVANPDVNLRATEAWRKEINQAVGFDPSDQRQGAIIKGHLDAQTEGLGGDLYKQARQAYQRHAQLFQNNAIVADLLETKPGTADRRVALDDVIGRIVLKGSREDLSALRRTLHVSDQHAGVAPGGAGPGSQAWREVQGATLRYIADEAGAVGKNASRDTAGRPIISFAGLNKAIRTLDDGGRLDFILGKKDAQTVRDIADVAAVIKTVPPGSVNTSNTAATLIAALGESAVTGALTGLPAPLYTIAKFAKQYRDAERLRVRVQDALEGMHHTAPTPAPQPRKF
jgi:hypothetical protein